MTTFLPPARVAELRDPLCRAHDVCKEHGGQHPIGFGVRGQLAEERLDLAGGISEEDAEVVVPRQLGCLQGRF